MHTGENIADNGGLKAAYNAYIRTENFDEDDVFPLSNMTHRQLFFVSFAQVRLFSEQFFSKFPIKIH